MLIPTEYFAILLLLPVTIVILIPLLVFFVCLIAQWIKQLVFSPASPDNKTVKGHAQEGLQLSS